MAKPSPTGAIAEASSSLISRLTLPQSYPCEDSSSVIADSFAKPKGTSYPLTIKQLEGLEKTQHLHSIQVVVGLTLTSATSTTTNLTSCSSGDNGRSKSSIWQQLANVAQSLSSRFNLLAAGNFSQEVDVTILHENGRLSSGAVDVAGKTESLLSQLSKVSSSQIPGSGREEVESFSSFVDVSTKNGKMKENSAVEVLLKSLLSGGVAGMCAKTAVAPLDRIKILLQAHSRHYSHLGVFSGLKGIVEKERFIALYKGNGAQMVRIFPYAATQFTSFETYKKLFGENSHIGRFAAGSAAGVTAVALTYPLDTIRARLAFQVSGEHLYSGIYQCATHIFREEGGVRALYRGFTPTICGMIPYAGLSFYCFESFKFFCMKYSPGLTCKQHSTNTGGLVLLLPFKLLCGGVAGAVAQTASYPLDVTRRRMQLAMMNESTKRFGMGMVSTLKIIYEENGVSRGLYRGMSINYLRAIPMVAVSFTTYEMVKQLLNLDTGLPMKTG